MVKKPEISLIVKLLTPSDFNDQSQQHIGSIVSNLNVLFGIESVFQFICPACIASDSLNVLQGNQDEIITEYKKQVTVLKRNNTRLSNENARLKEDINNPPSTSSDGAQAQDRQIIDLQNRVASLELIINDVKSTISSQLEKNASILNLIEKCKGEIDVNNTTLKSAHNVIEKIGSGTSVIDDSGDANPNRDSSTTQAEQKIHEVVNIDIHLCPPEDVIKSKTNTLIPNAATKSSSVNQSNRNDNDNKFEIYVTKFNPKHTCDDIEQYIVNKTSLKADQFSVKLLLHRKLKIEKMTFVSFKITTLKRDVFEIIMNDTLWAPHFKASLFSSKKTTSKKGTKVHWNDQQNTPAITVTPKVKRPHNQLGSARRNLARNGANNGNSTSKLVGPQTDSLSKGHRNKSNQNIQGQQKSQQQQSVQQQQSHIQFQQLQPQFIPLMIQPPAPTHAHFTRPENQNFWTIHNGLQQPQPPPFVYPCQPPFPLHPMPVQHLV